MRYIFDSSVVMSFVKRESYPHSARIAVPNAYGLMSINGIRSTSEIQ
ncbi:hypothetical protein [Candidatus Methanodesulfokora washburnensis]|jgi:hypothetical protein|nr:hypothetical protein [Candidatus Methanodesulfokores washburnensis]